MKVFWSDSLEKLAKEFFAKWSKERSMFRKTCVVVHDMATRDWLKHYYLMESGCRDVLMNIEFIPLPEFVNNWLFAKTHDEPLGERSAKSHPYSQPVLTWRIYRMLSDEASLEAEMQPLLKYIGNDAEKAPARRFALSARLAKLYDDYLNSRYAMLHNWENGDTTPIDGVPEWQRILYMRLVAEDANTYAKDYASIVSSDNTHKATENGFPEYTSIHVFDIPDMPEPTFFLLEQIAKEQDVTFWTYNPTGDWLADTPKKNDAIRNLYKKLRESLHSTREALRNGKNPEPPIQELDVVFADDCERLLGALGNGTRAVLGAQVDKGLVSPDDVLYDNDVALERLGKLPVAVHNCYSPRRELEAIRNGIHDFLKEHKDATPRDVLVLCGDWDNYAPIIDSVFGINTNISNEQEKENVQQPISDHSQEATNTGSGFIPLNIMGSMTGDSPLTSSFSDLMAFRENRFEASAVFALLSVPAIRDHFGLEDQDVDTLLDMAQKANIHWGLDDDDVNATVGMENAKSNYPFTWRRGLDRMALDMVLGPLDDGETLVDANDLGELLPCGNVENTRVKCLQALNSFIEALARIRSHFSSKDKYTAEEWEVLLLETVSEFYEDAESNVGELSRIRKAIQAVKENAMNAGMTEPIESDVFINAVLSCIRSVIPRTHTPADAVVFAPLKSACATPHKFVWICGLNDGKFPHIEYRASFDAIGKHPSVFDVNSRDKDGFALLKASLAAKEQLSLSYVGHDIRSNEKIPSSVMLNELLEYLKSKAVNNVPVTYEHPLQGYSPRYFMSNQNLPKSYSATDYAVAKALVEKESNVAEDSGDNEEDKKGISAFDLNPNGDTIIPAEELADFLATPNSYLIKRRLGLKELWIRGIEDEDPLETNINRHLRSKIMLDKDSDEEQVANLANVLVEQGSAVDEESAMETINGILSESLDNWMNYPLKFCNSKNGESKAEFTCKDINVVAAYKMFRETAKIDNVQATYQLPENRVIVPFLYRRITLQTGAGDLDHVFFMEDATKIYDSTKARAWVIHVIGHAAGCKFATVMLSQATGANTFRPIEQDRAQEILGEYLEVALGGLPENYPDYEKESPQDDSALMTQIPEMTQIPKTVNTRK